MAAGPEMSDEHIYSGLPREEERSFESELRPRTFEEFVGRDETVRNLKTWMKGARLREEALDHVLFSGPPGLGKTTLAYIIANEMEVDLKTASGPALRKPRDLVGLLTGMAARDVLFIDEIHRMDVRVEEYLYTAMEDFFISIIIDPGPHSRTIKMELKPFTLVGATTREGLLTPPLRNRFQILERLDFYSPEELKEVVTNSAEILEIRIAEEAAELIARRSRGTPRVANRFLRRIRDVAQAAGKQTISPEIATEGLRRLGVDEKGLSKLDRRVLEVLADSASPVGLKTVAAVVGEQEDTIRDVYEPFLIRERLLERTARGRQITRRGLQVLGRDGKQPPTEQGNLL